MRRDERRFVIDLSAAVVVPSTVGWKLDDETPIRTVLFYAAAGMSVLRFALAIEPKDGREP